MACRAILRARLAEDGLPDEADGVGGGGGGGGEGSGDRDGGESEGGGGKEGELKWVERWRRVRSGSECEEGEGAEDEGE